MYFTKSNPAKVVDVKTIDVDLLCGEIVGMPLESLQAAIANVYRPMLAGQEAWGKCSADQVKPLPHRSLPGVVCVMHGRCLALLCVLHEIQQA